MPARPTLVIALAALVAALAACADFEEASPLPTPELPGVVTPTPEVPLPPTQVPAGEPSATATAEDAPLPVATEGFDLRTAVLFERGGEVWAYDGEAGRARLLLRSLGGASPLEQGDPWALAPDGRHLAAARNADGGPASLSIVTFPEGVALPAIRFDGRIDSLAWSYDARRVAFVVTRRNEMTGELLGQVLHLYDVNSGADIVLYQREFRPDEGLRLGMWLGAWVPGNSAIYVAFALEQTDDPGTLYVVSVRGGEPRLVSPDYLLKGGQAVCPLTSEVLLRRRLLGKGLEAGASPLYVARAGLDGTLSEPQLLSPEDWYVGMVAWSPEGQRVAVERLESRAHGTYAVHLWLFSLDGSAPRQLTADENYREEWPVWDPFGRTLIFDRWQAAQPQPAGLWATDLTSEPRLLDGAGAHAQAAAALP